MSPSRQFAQYQPPFTPIIESLRGLLAGAPSGGYAAAALSAWPASCLNRTASTAWGSTASR